MQRQGGRLQPRRHHQGGDGRPPATGRPGPSIDLTALRGQLTGHSPGDVRNIIEHHLNHVQNVVVSQSPIPFFWLPFFASRIEIDESFVNTAGS
jgi:hypothetical protein